MNEDYLDLVEETREEDARDIWLEMEASRKQEE